MQTKLFVVVFSIIACLVLCIFVTVGAGVVKTIQCSQDPKCMEAAGHHVGAFVKGVKQSAE